jgi:A/G-specific adenine glycosylase
MKTRILNDVPTKVSIISFRRRITYWFDKHGRAFPWRQSIVPFKVLIAEMMLRRTKAGQVKNVFEELFKEFPDVQSLAQGNPKEIDSILYHLGLHWRTPAFQEVARALVRDYGGEVPVTREELKNLPGVGEYVAGAVLSIAYSQKEWIVDSNVVRVFKRYFGVDTSKEGRRDQHVIEMAKTYVLTSSPRKANLAIIDFAALVCVPGKPKHEECPIKNSCDFYKQTQHGSS